MKKQLLVILCLVISISLSAQQRTLSYYQSAAHTNSPAIKENINLQKFNLLQNDIIKAQFKKPQVNFSADYLFAPYFFNKGKLISITSNPSSSAVGYDAALTDGGLYAAQVSVTKSLFNRKSINALLTESQTENKSLQLNQTQLQHDLEKSVNEQYIAVYQIQLQREFLANTITMLADRLLIMDALVKKNLTKQSDYLALEVELTAKLFELKQLHSSSISAISQLNSLCGISDTTVYSLAPPKIEQSIPVSRFLYEDKYLNDSLSIVAKQGVSNSKYNPQFEIFGNTGLNSTNSSTIPNNFGITAGFHLNISIYDGMQRRITESQSKILLDNSRIYRNSYIIKVQNELLMINRQVLTTKESLSILEKQLIKQKSLLSSYEGELSQGQISIMDYIIALQEYSSTIQKKVQTESDLLLLINQYNYLNW